MHDPVIIRENGTYYIFATGHGVTVWSSRDMANWTQEKPVFDAPPAWAVSAVPTFRGHIWAPELHRIGDSWYIYVAASDGNNANHRMHVLERNAVDPFGPFTYKAEMFVPTDRWAIDGTVFEWQGTQYFVWSGWPGTLRSNVAPSRAVDRTSTLSSTVKS